ncbi:MAG: tRNA (adenosine(37)-N6)-dimethylallyltransferase MiaA [Geminicoccales bacterium]
MARHVILGRRVIGSIVIGGPTASGKSSLALHLAETCGGVIINADSMQLYRELRIVTARPGQAEEARVAHRLYGVLAADQPGSAGRWLALAQAALEEACQGRPPVVVGGTGLYLHALLHGLAAVPPVTSAIRVAAAQLYDQLGGPGFRALLRTRDPVTAARLEAHDRQRLIRAYEVVTATGRSLAEWQARAPLRLVLPEPVVGLALVPPRALLHARIADRLAAMIDAGALDELEALSALRLAPDLPLMKAVAVRELLAHVEGRLDLASALARATVQTRRYAKRQLTWFRHQMPELTPLPGFGDAPEILAEPAVAAIGRAC